MVATKFQATKKSQNDNFCQQEQGNPIQIGSCSCQNYVMHIVNRKYKLKRKYYLCLLLLISLLSIGSIALLLWLKFSNTTVYYQPEQIHLSLGDDPSQIVVTWTTFSDTQESVVEFGDRLQNRVVGFSTLFTDGGLERRTQFIHKVKLWDLKPNATYMYHCGSDYGWSSKYSFHTPKSGSNWSPHLVVFGDMGNENAQSLPRLQEEIQQGMYDAVIHVGDFAYDMDSNNARVGDEFMRQIEPIAAIVPYMTCVGNHENKYNFSNYKNRFSMPRSENMFYSFNLGPVHFIAFSTEFYYFTEYGTDQILRQFNWLDKDLQVANLPTNRQKHPWIVTYGHRPMYCSNGDKDDCTKYESKVRAGFENFPGLEGLFYKYGVDLEFWAHEHSYERLWPIYNRKVCNGSWDAPYTNPSAPVHITTGSAGSKEKHDPFMVDVPEWSAFRSGDYGYTRLKVQNASHIHLEQVSDDKHGKVIDEIWIVKDTHGSYT